MKRLLAVLLLILGGCATQRDHVEYWRHPDGTEYRIVVKGCEGNSPEWVHEGCVLEKKEELMRDVE